MRAVRRLSTAGLLIAALGVLLLAFPQRVGAQETDATPEGGFVDVIKVDGLLDPIMVNFIELSIAQSEKDQALAQFVQALRGYWIAHYRLRRLTLYDFALNQPVE